MGHEYSDMDPAGYRRQQKRLDRLDDLRDSLKNVKLAWFSAQDVPLLNALFDDWDKLSNDDIDRLEKLSKKISKKMADFKELFKK